MKKAFVIPAALLATTAAFGLDLPVFNVGSAVMRVGELLSPLRDKTITYSYHESALGSGKLLSNVNVFNGQTVYSLPLEEVSCRGKLSWPLVMQYGGNTRLIVDADNEVSPPGWLGLGWSMETPYVAINHKGTFTSEDDVVFVSLGGDGGGQLLRKGGRLFIANNPFIKVSNKVAASGDLADQVEEWTFETPSGIKYILGQADGAVSNSERTAFHDGALVKVSPYSLAQAKPFIYRWDLRKIVESHGVNEILFKHRKFGEEVYPGRAGFQYTRESYIDTIQWNDRLGNPVDQYAFVLSDKQADEFVKEDVSSPRTFLRPVETKFLSKIICFTAGQVTKEIRLSYSNNGASGKYLKRMLTGVQAFHNHPTSAAQPGLTSARPWTFAYETATRHHMLKSVTTPSGAQDIFQYKAFVSDDFFPIGMQDPLDDTLKTLASGTLVPVEAPADDAQRNKWQNHGQCDERFCYSTVTTDERGTRGQRLYAEIVHNPGNYFDRSAMTRLHGVSDGTDNDWTFTPAGDYVALVNSPEGRVFPFNWNGEGFDSVFLDPGPVDNPAGARNFFGNPAGKDNPISFHAAGGYFLVHKYGAKNKTWVFVEENEGPRNRPFRRLNQNSAACDINNYNWFGQDVKDGGDGCLEWKGSDRIQIFTGPNMFTIVHDPTDVIHAYAQNRASGTFKDVSGNFVGFDPDVHDATHPNNWRRHIEGIVHGPDYFVVKSVDGARGRLDVMHYDGSGIRRVASSGWHADGAEEKLTVVPGSDYFLEANHTTGQIVYWKKAVSADGLSLSFQPTVVRTDWNADNMDLRMRAYAGTFTVEYLANGVGASGRIPLLETPADPASTCSVAGGGPMDYRSYLYQVTRGGAQELIDRSPDLRVNINGCKTKLFDVAYSVSDNFVNGISARNGDVAGGTNTCQVTNTLCNILRATAKAKLRAQPGQPYFYDFADMVLPDFGSTIGHHEVMAEAARLGMSSFISTPKRLVLQRFYAYDGRDFNGAPDNLYYVEKVIHKDAATPLGPDVVTSFTHSIGEFNYYAQSPMFEAAGVRPVGDRDVGGQDIVFNIDLASGPLRGRRIKLNGTTRLERTMAGNGVPMSISVPTYMDEAELTASAAPEWPEQTALNRVKSVVGIMLKDGNSRFRIDSLLAYSNRNGQPTFTKVMHANRWQVGQSILNDTGIVAQTIQYSFDRDPGQPNGPQIPSAPAKTPLDMTHAVSSLKNEFEPGDPFLLKRDSTWRDVDETMTDADERAGRRPVYNLGQGWAPKDETSARNRELQPTELKAFQGGDDVLYTSAFYESRRANPSGVITNSRLANCAILMAENGDVPGLSTPDWEGRWASSGAAYSTAQVHTGRYSFKVTDNRGPNVNLFLERVRADKIGITASAWIYAGPGVTPALKVERRDATGMLIDSFSGSPVEGSKIDNRWQRWEVTLTPAQLTAGGLFDGLPDLIHVWVGTGSPSGNPSKVVYVDDIVIRPSKANFAMTAYTSRGQPTAQTNTQNLIHRFEYDFKGEVTAVRDERLRMLSQSANHLPGDND